MLSTNYRLRLEFICKRIATGQPIELDDRIWATKLGVRNTTAASMLRQAERLAQNPESAGDLLSRLDIGGIGEDAKGIRGFESPEHIAEWFKPKRSDDWRQRD